MYVLGVSGFFSVFVILCRVFDFFLGSNFKLKMHCHCKELQDHFKFVFVFFVFLSTDKQLYGFRGLYLHQMGLDSKDIFKPILGTL